jgi:ABC-type Fe3+/spermidine/putrescine transport system ATPase subunit
LQRETSVTTIMVTHDQEEALALSDTIGVMASGRLLQIGSPEEVYHRPRTPFVARFLGEANLLPGDRLPAITSLPAPRSVSAPTERPRMVRPERVVVGPESEECPLSWDSTVTAVTFLGADRRAEVRCDSGLSLIVRTRHESLRPGERVRVGVPADASWIIPEDDP